MREVAPQIGAATPDRDTPQAWADTIQKALGRMTGFGEVACAACGRDLARGLAFCPFCGFDFAAGFEAPRLPRRRELVRMALARGMRPGELRGVSDAELAALVGLRCP